jgi:hypothetical protein
VLHCQPTTDSFKRSRFSVFPVVFDDWGSGKFPHHAGIRTAFIKGRLEKELSMKNIRRVKYALVFLLAAGPVLFGADLLTYRGFQLGMGLNAAVKHSGMDPSEVTVIHERPARMQELSWHPARFSRASAESDPVEKVAFSFYQGQLFRIVVDYDASKTTGLTTQDMIEGISAQYGPATRPGGTVALKSYLSEDLVPVLARWEDAQSSWNLVQVPYASRLTLLIFSKSLNTLAETAVAEGIRLDEQEAPQRQKRQEQDAQAQLQKTRLFNKAQFRP